MRRAAMPDVALFEIGPEFAVDAPDGQQLVAAGMRAGATPRSWLAPPRPVDAMDAKADLWAALAALGVPMDALMVTHGCAGFYHPGPFRPGAAGAEDGAGEFRRDCIRACWRRWICRGRWWRSS